ncbi:MAG: DUF4097 family beta strand repeat-containing protein [Actinocatenispora sp.]
MNLADTTERTRPTGGGNRPTGARRGLIISGVAFAVLIVVLGGAVLLSLRQAVRPTHHATPHHSYSGVQTLHVKAGSSDIEVAASHGSSKDVSVVEDLSWTHRRPSVAIDRAGDTLDVHAQCPDSGLSWGFRTCGVRVRITVPADMPVDLEAASGDLTASGLTHAVRLRASSGDVSLDRLSGPVDARVTSGNVHATALSSETVRTQADSGDISLAFRTAPKAVTAGASSGDVHVEVPRASGGYHVSSTVASGDSAVRVSRNDGSARRITVRASSGDVTVAYRD